MMLHMIWNVAFPVEENEEENLKNETEMAEDD